MDLNTFVFDVFDNKLLCLFERHITISSMNIKFIFKLCLLCSAKKHNGKQKHGRSGHIIKDSIKVYLKIFKATYV
jgi:hypothetical protein